MSGALLSKSALKIYSIYLSVLLVQMLVYYFPTLWVMGSEFRASTFLARTLFPLFVSFSFLGYSWAQMGFAKPRLSARLWRWVLGFAVLVVVLVPLIQLSQNSQQFYRYLNAPGPAQARFWSFAVFTLSTLPAWEWMHRSFLLFGLRNILTRDFKLKPEIVHPLIIAQVCAFEVLFHFQKPMLEALGMIVASFALSWLALESESIWLSFLLHHLVEVVFFFAITA